VGLHAGWTPVDRGVDWLAADELARRWDTAALVVLTVDALHELPAGLTDWPGVYLCAAGAVEDRYWPAVVRLRPDAVVTVPAGRPWLFEQLADPVVAYRRSKFAPVSGARA